MTITSKQVDEALGGWLEALDAKKIAAEERAKRYHSQPLRGTSDPGAAAFEASIAAEEAAKARYMDLGSRHAAQQIDKRDRTTQRLAVTNTLLALAICAATAVQAWTACSAERREQSKEMHHGR
jgi:hypothetical protein